MATELRPNKNSAYVLTVLGAHITGRWKPFQRLRSSGSGDNKAEGRRVAENEKRIYSKVKPRVREEKQLS